MDADIVAERKAQELTGGNAFAVFNHLEVEHVEPDYAVFKLAIRPESKNPRGFVHGGLLAGMADNAAGYAAHSDGRTYVTQSSHMNYLHNQAPGAAPGPHNLPRAGGHHRRERRAAGHRRGVVFLRRSINWESFLEHSHPASPGAC